MKTIKFCSYLVQRIAPLISPQYEIMPHVHRKMNTFISNFLTYPSSSVALKFYHLPNEYEHTLFILLRLTYFTQHNTPHSIHVEANGGYLSFLMAE